MTVALDAPDCREWEAMVRRLPLVRQIAIKKWGTLSHIVVVGTMTTYCGRTVDVERNHLLEYPEEAYLSTILVTPRYCRSYKKRWRIAGTRLGDGLMEDVN